MKKTLMYTLFALLMLVSAALNIYQTIESIKLHTTINSLRDELQTLTEEAMTAQNLVEEATATIQEESHINTTAIEQWCKGFSEGDIRVLGAWVYSREDNVVVLEDETGELWEVEDVNVADDDFLLVWLADNNTPTDRSDDIVLKLWIEAHS